LEILHVLAAVGVDIADGFGKAWKPYLYQPELRGREELLTDVIDDVIERGSDHRLIVLAGPSGSGKSRIALEVIGELSVESLGVLIGQCRPDREGTGVLQPFASMIRHVMDHRSPGLAASKETLKRARRVLGPYMPFLAPEQPDRVPSYLPVSVAQIRIETLLTAYSRDEPMVVVIDDLQWADSLTQRALDYFLRNQPLWTFLATLRSDEMTPSLDAILGHEGSRVVPVERLSSGAVQEIIRDMLGQETVPAALSKTVKAYANGNPFFAAACMRALIEEEVLSLDERGCWRICEIPEAFSMPEELLDSLRKRLSFLHVEARTLCEVASSLGRRSPLDVLEDVVALKGVDFDRAVADLAQRQILQWSRRAGSEELEFVHDQLVDLAYHSLANDEERCRRVHRQVVHSLRAKSARGDYVDTGHVAVHLERAGLLEEARLAYFESARQACARHGLAEAETLVMSGLRLSEVEDGPSLAAKIHFAKEVLAIQGRMKEAEKWLRDAVEKTASDVPTLEHAQALQALGRVLMWTGRAGETLEIFAAVREVFRALGNHRNEAKALGHMGIARRNQYRYAEALAHYEEALEITREVGDRSGEGIHLCNAGIVYKEIGQLRRALVHYEAAGKIATDLGDKRLSGIVLGNTGFIDMEQGRYEASFENFRAALQISRNLGDKRREGIWLSCLGRTHRLVGEFDEARKVQSEALELLRKTAVRIGLGVGLCEWGHLNLLAGQTAENELAEAALLAEELSVGPKSDLAVGLTRLQRAADAHARGEKLHFGECLDDVLASDQGESVDRDTAFMETNRWDP
jgi:tetratricopeptide (TPR) repeat protein